MKNKINNNIIFSISTLFFSLSNFLFVYILTRNLSPTEYGELNFIIILSTIISIILLAGTDQIIMRYFYFKSTLSILRNYAIIFLPLNFILFAILYIYYRENYLLIFTFSNSLVLFRIVNVLLRMNSNAIAYTILNIGSKGLEFMLILYIVYINKINYFYAISSNLISITLFSFVILIIYFNKIFKNKSENIKMIHQYSYGIPISIAIILTTLSQNIDKLIAPYIINGHDLGIYFSAFKLTSFLLIFQNIYSLIFLPNIIKKYEYKKEVYLFKNLRNVQSVIIILFFVFILMTDYLVYFLGDAYKEANQILPILFLIPYFMMISEIGSAAITLKENSRLHLIISVIYLILNFALVNFLGTKVGIIGIASSVGISSYIYYLMRTYLGFRVINEKINFFEVEFFNIIIIVTTIISVFNMSNVFIYILILLSLSYKIYYYRRS